MFDFFKKNKENKEKINDFRSSLLMNSDSKDKFLNKESNMIELFGESKKLNKKLNLLVVCDTNNSLDELRFADYIYRNNKYDACIILGNVGINDIEVINKYVDKNRLYSTQVFDNIKNIDGDFLKINGVSILIVGKKKFSQEESIKFFDDLKEADVLLTYDSKYKIDGGFFGIDYYLYKNKVPYFVHGNMFKNFKDTLKNGTVEIGTFEYEYLELE